MKIPGLTIALLGLCAVPIAQAQNSLTLYGMVDSGIEYSKAGSATQTRVISGGAAGSRVGFRGNEDLGDGLNAIFRLEMGFLSDDGSLGQGGRMFGRESSLGLSSKDWGTLSLGRLPLPYYLVQSRVDAFGWIGNGGLLAITRSGPTFNGQLAPQAVSARVDNAVGYQAPLIGRVQVRALVAAGEKSPTQGRNYSLSAAYTANDLDLVAGWARQRGGGDNGGKIDSVVVGGSYNFGWMKAFAGYTEEANSCSTCTGALARLPGIAAGRESTFRIINVGARFPIGLLTLVGQITRIQDRSDYAALTGDRDVTFPGVGLEYRISKRTLAYAGLATVNNKNGSSYAIGTGTAQRTSNNVGPGDPRSWTTAVGMNHTF